MKQNTGTVKVLKKTQGSRTEAAKTINLPEANTFLYFNADDRARLCIMNKDYTFHTIIRIPLDESSFSLNHTPSKDQVNFEFKECTYSLQAPLVHEMIK